MITEEGSALLLQCGPPDDRRYRSIDLPDGFARRLQNAVFGNGVTGGAAGSLEASTTTEVADHVASLLDWTDRYLAAPIATALGKLPAVDDLVVLPGGATTSLPWCAALGARLGLPVTQSPAAVSRIARRGDRTGPAQLLLIADPSGTLHGAKAEVAAIRKVHAAADAVTLGPGRADVATIRAAAGDATLIHFAGHARFDPYHAERSGLLIDDGQLLSIDAIARLAPLAREPLVVLAGCESGVADFAERGHEAIGLASAWLVAGARAVIGALWKVSDAAAAIYFIDLHRRLVTGTAPARATREAARALRETDRDSARRALDALRIGSAALQTAARRSRHPERPFDHPYYWAAFACFALPIEGEAQSA